MKDSSRISREKKTLKIMIGMYCNAHHCKAGGSCMECDRLYDYAMSRIDKCPYHEYKPVCGRCPVHCYEAEMREDMRAIMRHSGPRILLSHPVFGIMHIIDRIKYKTDREKNIRV
jgi:hypothetical protein